MDVLGIKRHPENHREKMMLQASTGVGNLRLRSPMRLFSRYTVALHGLGK